jgi:hypothetical protein
MDSELRRFRRAIGACASRQGDGQGNGLHGDDEGRAGGPFSQRPEGSGDHAGGGSAQVIAGHVEAGGGDARAGRRGNAEMALRGGLGDEDPGGNQGQAEDDDQSEGARVSSTPAMEQAMAPAMPARRPTRVIRSPAAGVTTRPTR